jgi:DNA-binding response OmpR family regulator
MLVLQGGRKMKKKILVVDDEPHIVNFLKLFFEHEYTVYEARSAIQATALAMRLKPDVILLDTSLPNIDGYQTCARLKAHPQTKQIPVLLMIARYLPNQRMALAKSGADEVIAKPFDPHMLKRRMERLLGGVKYEQTIIR